MTQSHWFSPIGLDSTNSYYTKYPSETKTQAKNKSKTTLQKSDF